MLTLYSAADPIEAEILKDYLDAHGIAVTISGGYAWGGRGDLPADIYPRLHLCDERDDLRARELLRLYERRGSIASIWRCACGEASPLHFELCWSCEAARPA